MNKKSKLKLAISALAISATGQVALAGGHGEITVAYFLEWPMPFEYAKQKGTYEDEMGVKINWVSFESGVKMSAAMASGDAPKDGWQRQPWRLNCELNLKPGRRF